jgi:hypothetical protein
VREFLPKDQPYVLLMPIWNVPGISVGRQPSPNFDTTQGHLYLFTSPEVHKWISDEGLKLGVWPYINYPTFARAIARIAYCQAVANMGLDGFNPLDLPALILGTYQHVPHYVGVMRDIPPPPDTRNMCPTRSNCRYSTRPTGSIGWRPFGYSPTAATAKRECPSTVSL